MLVGVGLCAFLLFVALYIHIGVFFFGHERSFRLFWIVVFWFRCSKQFCYAANFLVLVVFSCRKKFFFAAIFVCLSPWVSVVVLWFMHWWVSNLFLVCMALVLALCGVLSPSSTWSCQPFVTPTFKIINSHEAMEHVDSCSNNYVVETPTCKSSLKWSSESVTSGDNVAIESGGASTIKQPKLVHVKIERDAWSWRLSEYLILINCFCFRI